MSESWIESQVTKYHELNIRIVNLADQYPNAFKILPIAEKPDEKGHWADYEFDGTVKIWANTTHPNAIKLYQEILFEKKEQIKRKNFYSPSRRLTKGGEND